MKIIVIHSCPVGPRAAAPAVVLPAAAAPVAPPTVLITEDGCPASVEIEPVLVEEPIVTDEGAADVAPPTVPRVPYAYPTRHRPR